MFKHKGLRSSYNISSQPDVEFKKKSQHSSSHSRILKVEVNCFPRKPETRQTAEITAPHLITEILPLSQ